jgi:hypothetical protein
MMSFPVIDYQGPPIYIPQFADHLHLGSFIEFEDHPGSLQVGCIVRQARDVNNLSRIYVNFYDDFSYDPAYGALSPNLQNLQEIQQTRTTTPIYIKDIKDIAFVFTPEDVIVHSITLTSKWTHGYLVRFNINKVNGLYVPVADHVPFPCTNRLQAHCFEQCISMSIFQALKTIRNAISSILGRGSASLSDFNRDTQRIPLCLRAFNYLCRNLHFYSRHASSQSNTLIDVFGTQKRQRTTRSCYLFRCETMLQLGVLNHLLAGGCLIGNRHPPPKFGCPPRHNASGDILNIVPGNIDSTENHKRSNVQQNGIDLLFFSDLNLDVSVRFVRLTYRSNNHQIGILIAPPPHHNVTALSTNNIGRLFRRNQSSFIVFREYSANGIDYVVARASNSSEITVPVDSVSFMELGNNTI